MRMESQVVLVNGRISKLNGSVSYVTDQDQVYREIGSSLVGGDEKRKGNSVEEVLDDFEEYWEDINDRLVVSRMVSDSVVKGIVTAVEEDAAEKVKSRELEVANLKEYWQSHDTGSCRFEGVKFPGVSEEFEDGKSGRFSCFPSSCVKLEKMRGELHALRNLAREQHQNAKKDVDFVRLANPFKKIGSDNELVGLGRVLGEKQLESWMHVDRMLESLKETMDNVCTKVDDILLSAIELQQDQYLSAELESMVMGSIFKRLKDDYEEKMWEKSPQFCGIHNVNWLEKFNEIASLGPKLDAVLNSFTIRDTGIDSHVPYNLDHLHHKACCNHVTIPSGENGILDASSIHIAELYDFQQLKHLSKEGLVDYFNNVITKLKRDHESVVQQKTEEYFRLKREFLKEKGSFVIYRKDREFDVPREKIREVILKLDSFLLENERFPALSYSLESIGKLQDRLDNLLIDNHVLRDCLTDKENELKDLEARVAGTAVKLLKQSSCEEAALENAKKLNSAVEDSCVQALLSDEVYKHPRREQIAQKGCDLEDSHMEFLITREIYDIILKEAVFPAKNVDSYKNVDSDIEALIMEGLSGLVIAEVIKDAVRTLNDLNQEVLIDKDSLICLEVKILEQDNLLRCEVEENDKLKQEIVDLGTTLKQKEKSAKDLSISLSKERERFELASQELLNLREHVGQQQMLIAESNRELQLLRSQHLQALGKIDIDKQEMYKLRQMLDETTELLTKNNKQRDVTFSGTQEMHEKLSSEAREKKLKEEVEVAVSGISEMFNKFECSVLQRIKRNRSRLEDMSLHLKDLNGIPNALRRTELSYKLQLERRYADLQMAEAEVDLLGDEVDALVRVLWKVYVALNHYSPVLKHYPGIIEILELVRRELSEASTTPL